MIAALIFDVDGTLAETEEYHRRAFNLAFSEVGLDWYWDAATYAALLAITGGKERIRHFAESRAGAPEPVAEAVIAALHRRKTAIYGAYLAAGAIPLRPGMRAFIEAAEGAGLTLAIATTTSLPNVEGLLASAFGATWQTRFAAVAAGDMVAAKKPAPDVYRFAMARLGLAPEACLAVEDSRNGVEAARAAGLRTLAFRSHYLHADDLTGADLVLDADETPAIAHVWAIAGKDAAAR